MSSDIWMLGVLHRSIAPDPPRSLLDTSTNLSASLTSLSSSLTGFRRIGSSSSSDEETAPKKSNSNTNIKPTDKKSRRFNTV